MSCTAISSSSSAVNRAYGWNLVFLDSDDSEFAGVYQQDAFLVFADIFRELRLCFDFAGPGSLSLWGAVGDVTTAPVHEDDLHAREMPADPTVERTLLRLAIHARQQCGIPSSPLLDDHLQAQCARRAQPKANIKRPYLPINERARDLPPSLSLRSGRSSGSRSGSYSPRKRSRSGLQSPAKTTADLDDLPETAGLDGSAAAAAAEGGGSPELRLNMQQFRAAACARNDRCAVTGLGRAWTRAGGLGPGVNACHIVPQVQYNLYPDRWPPPTVGEDDDNGGTTVASAAFSSASQARLEQAWKNTWGAGNSILLLRHLHVLFDARFFSVHPETHRIRIFVPYDILLPYHGRKAWFDSRGMPDKRALGQHWDACCIENMMAAGPWLSLPSALVTPSLSLGGVGALRLDGGAADAEDGEAVGPAPQEPSKAERDGHGGGPAGGGGPKKTQQQHRVRPSIPGPGIGGVGGVDQTPHLTRSVESEADDDDLGDGAEAGRPTKRRRSLSGRGSVRIQNVPSKYRRTELTKENYEVFLADVDWALQQWKAAGV